LITITSTAGPALRRPMTHGCVFILLLFPEAHQQKNVDERAKMGFSKIEKGTWDVDGDINDGMIGKE